MARRTRGALLSASRNDRDRDRAHEVFDGGQAFPTPGAARLRQAIVQAPDFSTFGRVDFGFVARLAC